MGGDSAVRPGTHQTLILQSTCLNGRHSVRLLRKGVTGCDRTSI